MAAIEAAFVITLAVGIAVLLWKFAHDTTGAVVRTWLMIRMVVLGLFTILIAVFFVASGSLPLMLAGAFLLFMITLFVLYDPRLSGLRGAA